MTTRQYLMIKRAAINPGLNSFFNNYFDDAGTFNSNKFFSENPTEESWNQYVGDDAFWNQQLMNERRSYIQPQDTRRLTGLNDTYTRLTQPYGMTGQAPVVYGTRNSLSNNKATGERNISLDNNASIYTLLHERGHEYTHNNGTYIPGGGGMHTQMTATSLPFGYNLYNRNALDATLRNEQAASDYARNVISKIPDQNVRQRAMGQLEAELTPAYKTYDSYFGELLRADNRGRQLGGVAGGAIGGIGLGIGGAMLANKLLAKSNINGWKRGLLTAGAGVLSGALGAWAGNRLGGGSLGGYAGQLYAQNKNNRTGYMSNAQKQYHDATIKAQTANQDIGYLNNYLNNANTTPQMQPGASV